MVRGAVVWFRRMWSLEEEVRRDKGEVGMEIESGHV